jgi:hypothetical protein
MFELKVLEGALELMWVLVVYCFVHIGSEEGDFVLGCEAYHSAASFPQE